jgi:hypothetical protein
MAGELTVTDNVTLYALCDTIQCFHETLDSIDAALSTTPPDEERAALEDDRKALQIRIEEIGAQLYTKTDAVAAVIRRIASEQELVKLEEKRLHARRKAFERAEEWLRKYVVSVMQQKNITSLKTATNTLFLRSSEAVVITDAEKVSDVYQNAEVRLPLWLWNALVDVARSFGAPDVVQDVDAIRVKSEPSLSTIKKAIKSGATVAGADLRFNTNLGVR